MKTLSYAKNHYNELNFHHKHQQIIQFDQQTLYNIQRLCDIKINNQLKLIYKQEWPKQKKKLSILKIFSIIQRLIASYNNFMHQESQLSQLREELIKLIASKKEEPTLTSKCTLDWKQAEILITNKTNNTQLLTIWIEFQKVCIRNKVSCFHSFSVLQWSLNNPANEQAIQNQRQQLNQNKSKYHRIEAYIQMRQSMLAQITQFGGKGLNELFDNIDQIRFLNFEIINLIKVWKEQWRCEEQQPLFYDKGTNYLLKMNNDNADMINLANFKKTKFISPPNPFFLSQDGNFAGMSEEQRKQIDSSINLIAKQRFFDLKLKFQGAQFVFPNSTKPPVKRNSSESKISMFPKNSQQKQSYLLRKDIKEKGQNQRELQIRKIYAFKESVSSSKLRAWKQANQEEIRKQSQQQKELISQHNLQKIKKMESKIVELKQSYKVAPPEKRRFSSYTNKDKFVIKKPSENTIKNQQQEVKGNATQKKEQKKIQAESKVQAETEEVQIKSQINDSTLRHTVTKTLQSSNQTLKPSRIKEIREIKPKIKLISEKEVTVQQNIQAVTNFSLSNLLSPTSEQKNSNFYKPIQIVVEENQQEGQLPRPLTTNLSKIRSLTKVIDSQQKKQKEESKSKTKDLSKSKMLNRSKIKGISQNSLIQIDPKSLSIMNIYKNNGKKYKNNKIQSPNKTSYIQKEQIQNQTKKQLYQKKNLRTKIEQNLAEKQKTRAEFEKKLQQKVKVINQLESKIKELEDNQKQSTKKNQNKKRNYTYGSLWDQEKKMKQMESKILRNKIYQQELKFKKSKEEQIKLKQKEIQVKFKRQKDALLETHKKKLGEYKIALLAEEKKIKKFEQLYTGQQNKLSLIEYQLAEKDIKEKLLRKIIREKQRQKEEELLASDNEEQTLKKLSEELRERQRIELQHYQLIEKQRIKMQQTYKAMLEHNKQIQQEIQAKQAALNQLEAQKIKQIEAIKLEHRVQENTQNIVSQRNQGQIGDKKSQQLDIQAMKLKVKEELLQQILKQQEIARLEQQKEEEIRKQKLKKIQKEVQEVLRAEEIKLQLENAQFLAKIESLKNKSTTLFNLDSINNDVQKQQTNLEEKKKQQQNEKGNTFFITSELENNKINREQSVIDDLETELNLQQNNNHPEKEAKQFQPSKNNQQSKIEVKSKQTVLQSKMEAAKSKQQIDIVPTVNANKQAEILEKYKLLAPMLRKSTTIVVEDYNLPTFIQAFLSSFDKNFRQMLPWNKEVLGRNLRVKKGDIFDCDAFGWLQQKDKYYLVGRLDCLSSIIKKYGGIQVHQVFHFDKANLNHKQVIAKKIRDFEKIGYVYQKKVVKNIYSFRFVIILPKDKVEPSKTFTTSLTARINLEEHKLNQDKIKSTHGFTYLLAHLLKEDELSSKVKTHLQKQNSHFNDAIKKQLRNTHNNIQGVQIIKGKDSIEMTFNLPFKYYRDKDRLFYVVSGIQYNFQQKLTYVTHYVSNLVILIQPMKQDFPSVALDYYISQLNDKMSNPLKIKQIDVVLPVWSYSSSNYLQDLSVSYVYKEKMSADLNVSSISSSFLKQHTFVQIKAPFIFALCQWGKQQKRVLHSHLVVQQELCYVKMAK